MSFDGYDADVGPRRDDEVTQLLRALVAPPTDPAYWAGLEARVMARVRGAAPGGDWEDALTDWARAGLVAAGLALLAAGAALAHSRGAEARMAYEAVVTPTQAPLAPVARASGSAGREETLYYLISH